MKKYIASVMLLFAAVSCTDTEIEYIEKEVTKASAGEVTLTFDARYGDSDFELYKPLDYKLANGQGEFDLQYNFSRLRYWVSNVVLINDKGEEYVVPESYYLIEENNEIPIQDGS